MSDKEWLEQIESVSDEELMEHLEWCVHDNYYNNLYEPIIKEIKRRLKRQTMEEMLIDILKKASNADIQALLLETYIQKYGAISDENGEIVRQILTGRSE